MSRDRDLEEPVEAQARMSDAAVGRMTRGWTLFDENGHQQDGLWPTAEAAWASWREKMRWHQNPNAHAPDWKALHVVEVAVVPAAHLAAVRWALERIEAFDCEKVGICLRVPSERCPSCIAAAALADIRKRAGDHPPHPPTPAPRCGRWMGGPETGRPCTFPAGHAGPCGGPYDVG